MAGARVASKQPVVLTRADIIVTPHFAPLGCAAAIVIDREKLKVTGAPTLAVGKDGVVDMRAARAADEYRPWSPAPKRRWGRAVPFVAPRVSEEPETGAYASPLDYWSAADSVLCARFLRDRTKMLHVKHFGTIDSCANALLVRGARFEAGLWCERKLR